MIASISPSSTDSPQSTHLSPLLTPPHHIPLPNTAQSSPVLSDDSSILDDVSFVYEKTADGQYVRRTKGSTSSPPTPSDSPPTKAPSPIPPPRPPPLTRSESLPSTSSLLSAPRSFHRAISGPVAITPASSSSRPNAIPLSSGGTGRKIGGARRVKLSELPQADSQPRSTLTQSADEKDFPRLTRPLRPVRPVNKQFGIERIAEVGEEYETPAFTGSRPRRSASLSESVTSLEVDHVPYHRPGTSLGARRVTLEEKIRQEREIALEEGYARREAEEALARTYAPSPTQSSSHAHLRHQRKDSDTLRSAAAPASPTVVEQGAGRVSPGYSSSARHRAEPPSGKSVWMAEREREEPLKSVKSGPPPPLPVTRSASATTPSAAPDVRSRNMVVNKKAYARLDLIGKGGSSRVYRVMNNMNEIFAIKRVALDKLDQDTMNGYMNEIALLKRLDGNSRIIRLVDSELKPGPGGSKGHLMLVMECGEIDLARLLQEQQKESMDPVWVAYYWKQMLQAVHVIHEEKIVHSDLKPANFVLVRGQLKLIDFGIANAIANDTTNIQRDHQIGTVNYMSPEAIELPDGMRRLKVGRPSDVWSLGCILYQMVYGSPPFHALSVYQKMKAIPDESHILEFPDYSTPSVPAPRTSTQGASPVQKLDHLRVPVPQSLITTMQSCLVRSPKERATIPELVQMDWLSAREPPPPPPPPAPEPQLADDETIINPHFMHQLLLYGISLGKSSRASMSDDEVYKEATRLVVELKGVQSAPL